MIRRQHDQHTTDRRQLIQTITTRHMAMTISESPHHRAWDAAEIGDMIPYEGILVWRFAEITPEDKERRRGHV
jgi:hypothetical protein